MPDLAARHDGRAADQLRPVTITRGWLDHAEGACSSSSAAPACCAPRRFTEGVPRWRKGSGQGWVTAEYAMLPRATNTRSDRESVKGRIGGRTHEICRLDRPLAARRHRHQGARREHDRPRLRRAAGRRRHPHRGHHRRLRGARRRGRLGPRPRAGQAPAREPLIGSVAAVSVGIVDGVPRARPRLRRGRRGRDRHERRRAPATGGSSRCRAPPRARRSTAPSSTRCSTSPSAGCARAHPPAAGGAGARARRDEPVTAPAGARHPQRAQGRRAAADPRRRRRLAASSCVGRRRRSPRSRTSPRPARPSPRTPCSRRARSPPPPGCRRSPTTPGSASTCSAACPGVFCARWSGRHGDDGANLELLLGPARRRARRAPRRGVRLRGGARVLPGRRREQRRRGAARGAVVRAPRGTNGFGYDPVFVPEGDDPHRGRARPPAEKDAISHRGRAFRALAPAVPRHSKAPRKAGTPGVAAHAVVMSLPAARRRGGGTAPGVRPRAALPSWRTAALAGLAERPAGARRRRARGRGHRAVVRTARRRRATRSSTGPRRGSRTRAVSAFGTHDKLVLLSGAAVVLVVLSALAGVVAARGRVPRALGRPAARHRRRGRRRHPARRDRALRPAERGRRDPRGGGAERRSSTGLDVAGAEPGGLPRRTLLRTAGTVGGAGLVALLAGRLLGAARPRRRRPPRRRRAPGARGSRPAAPRGVEVGVAGVVPFRVPADGLLPDRHRPGRAAGRRRGLAAAHPRHGRPRGHADLRRPAAAPLVERDGHADAASPTRSAATCIGNARWLGRRRSPTLLAQAGPQPDADMVLSHQRRRLHRRHPAGGADRRPRRAARGRHERRSRCRSSTASRCGMVVPGLYGYVSATKWVVDLKVTRFDRARRTGRRAAGRRRGRSRPSRGSTCRGTAPSVTAGTRRRRRRRLGAAPRHRQGRGAGRRRRRGSTRTLADEPSRHLAAVGLRLGRRRRAGTRCRCGPPTAPATSRPAIRPRPRRTAPPAGTR